MCLDNTRLAVTDGVQSISLMDRTNLSAANIAGMAKDLQLQIGFRYSIITLVFFTTYVVFQFPSTIVIKKIGPRIHLGTICVLWGAVMIGYASCLFPSTRLIITEWALSKTGKPWLAFVLSLASWKLVSSLAQSTCFPPGMSDTKSRSVTLCFT
jgi:hypothetical protein